VNDDYPTCCETYVTLRLYHPSDHPEKVTGLLGLAPSKSQMVGETWEQRNKKEKYQLSGWFFTSEGSVDSYDSEKHLDWLLNQIEPKLSILQSLTTEHGWRADIACLWDSQSGHGGPTLSPALLRRLGIIGIELWFDVYFHGAYFKIRNRKAVDAIQQTS
jgi:hypothetical protein